MANISYIALSHGLLWSIIEKWDKNDKFIMNDIEILVLVSDVSLLLNMLSTEKIIDLNAYRSKRVSYKEIFFNGWTNQ